MDPLRTLIARWRDDTGGTYQTWFLWEERLKNFRSVRRGLTEVVAQIAAGTFGNVYRGSSLETVCDFQADVLRAIHELDARQIKGLGPAVANLLYFVHPTLVPPSNTAIVRGYNALTGANVKLGKWQEYLAMREGILRLNEQHRDLLSNDLGAIGVGSGRFTAPPRVDDANALAAWEADVARVREQSAATLKAAKTAEESDRTHTQVQSWLRDLGFALGFDVWIAANDRSRPCGQVRLGDGCLEGLPPAIADLAGVDSVRLIDVLWFHKGSDRVAAAFEVEHTTSIYSGIVRMLDLAFSPTGDAVRGLFLVAPDDREEEVRAQLARPLFQRVSDLEVRYLAYGELERHREAIARFGEGMKAINSIARSLR